MDKEGKGMHNTEANHIDIHHTHPQKKHTMLKKLKKQSELQLMVLPALICLLLFSIYPLYGLQIAFKDFKLNLGIEGSAWVGLKYFKTIFTDPNMVNVMKNTIGLSVIKGFVIFPLPIIFALMLQEITFAPFKKMVQTVSYFPYFLSWSIISLMATVWLSGNGFINGFLTSTHILKKPFFFLGNPKAFWGVSVTLDIWKTLGYSAVIYIAAMSGVDQEVMEAAVIDGAGRFKRMWHVTLPAILPTIMILLIINMGNLLKGGSNFDISYNLSNTLNLSKSEIIDTYVLKTGISLGRFSYAAAIGVCQSVISTVLLLISNGISKITTGEGYF